MNNYITKECPSCGTNLHLPSDCSNLKVCCPVCFSKFLFDEDMLYFLGETEPCKSGLNPKEDKKHHVKNRKVFTRRILPAAAIVLIIACIICIVLFFSVHHWKDANCTEPKTCTICGKTEGHPTGHSWTSATCTEPKTCTVCGEVEGFSLGHSWKGATCTDPKQCRRCHKTQGTALGHNWEPETLFSPKTCKRCGMVMPMAEPVSGQVYTGLLPGLSAPLNSEITIKTSINPVYVKLKNNLGMDIFSFYVRANDIVTVKIPAEQCYVYFASGNDWYGTQLYFGEYTSFSKDDQLQDFSKYTLTYTLYPVLNGNFEETPVTKSEFD